ncbi:MAG: hypothetical protein ACXVDD_15470 [Polyangia bacterium]
MKRVILLVMLGLGGMAGAAPLVPPPGRQPEPLRKQPLAPIPLFWDELDAQRVNEGLLGRKNATRDEQRVAETPSLQPRPLSSW